MAYLLVSYDLAGKPPEDYQMIEAFLNKTFISAHVLESVWVVETSISAREMESRLRAYVEDDDGVIVAPIGGKPFWHGLNETADDWLRRRFPR